MSDYGEVQLSIQFLLMFHCTYASGTQTSRGKGDQYKTLQACFGQHDVRRVPQISHACSEMENKEKQATERLHTLFIRAPNFHWMGCWC